MVSDREDWVNARRALPLWRPRFVMFTRSTGSMAVSLVAHRWVVSGLASRVPPRLPRFTSKRHLRIVPSCASEISHVKNAPLKNHHVSIAMKPGTHTEQVPHGLVKKYHRAVAEK